MYRRETLIEGLFYAINIKPGWLVSNRINQGVKKNENDFDYTGLAGTHISKGIHVFFDSRSTKRLKQDDYRDTEVLRVKCYKKDFIAASVASPKDEQWEEWGGEAVFMKFFIPKSEIDRVKNKVMKQR